MRLCWQFMSLPGHWSHQRQGLSGYMVGWSCVLVRLIASSSCFIWRHLNLALKSSASQLKDAKCAPLMPSQSPETPISTHQESRLSTSLSKTVSLYSRVTDSSSSIRVKELHNTAHEGATQSSCPSCHLFKPAAIGAVSLLLMDGCMSSAQPCTMTSLYDLDALGRSECLSPVTLRRLYSMLDRACAMLLLSYTPRKAGNHLHWQVPLRQPWVQSNSMILCPDHIEVVQTASDLRLCMCNIRWISAI